MCGVGERTELIDEGIVPRRFQQFDVAVLALRRERVGAVRFVADLALRRNHIALQLPDHLIGFKSSRGSRRLGIVDAGLFAVAHCGRFDLLLDIAGRPTPANNVEYIEDIVIRIDAEQNTDDVVRIKTVSRERELGIRGAAKEAAPATAKATAKRSAKAVAKTSAKKGAGK